MRFTHKELVQFFLLVFSIPFLAGAAGIPADVKNAAKEGINFHLKGKKIDNGMMSLGFISQEVIDNAEPGEGFEIFIVDSNKIFQEPDSQDVNSVLIPTGEWFVLVKSDGKAYSTLQISLNDGKSKTHGLGFSSLATELSGVLATWPASSGYEYKYIRVYPASAYFIALSKRGKMIGVIPLTYLRVEKPSRVEGEFSPSDLLHEKEVLSHWRTAFMEHRKMNLRMKKGDKPWWLQKNL